MPSTNMKRDRLNSTDVKRVTGGTDRFIHSYEFDAKQRLIEVSTSHDDVIWKRDARYEYAKHGPMKRTLLGEDAVQGVDFTYTLHGQLKAINTPDRSPLTDPGQDGNTALTDVKDAFGLALNYYTDDFNRVGGSVSSPFNTGGPAMLAPPVDLYGGLTGSMSWSTQAVLGTPATIVRNQENIGETYRYDVLGRLRTVTTNKDNSGTFAAEPTGGWSSQYKYDPHGNVLSVFKRGLDATATSIVLDDATMTLKQTGVAPSTSNIVLTVDDGGGDHGLSGQEVQPVAAGYGGSDVDEKGRVTKYSSPSNAVETSFNANDLALTAKRKDHTTTFLRDAFDQIVRQDVNSGTTDNTYVTIPLSPLVSQAIYHYDGIETVQILEWTIQDGNRIGVDRTTASTLVDGVNYRPVGDVLYELKDQVGSVRALVSDVVDEDPNNAGKYQARVLSVSDYEAFGSRRYNRYSELTAPYRYGWQGMTLMDGHDVRFDYVTPFRLYDTRVGRWTASDLIFNPSVSPFEGMASNPLMYTDAFGLEPEDGERMITSPVIEVTRDKMTPAEKVDFDNRWAQASIGTQITQELIRLTNWLAGEIRIEGNYQHTPTYDESNKTWDVLTYFDGQWTRWTPPTQVSLDDSRMNLLGNNMDDLNTAIVFTLVTPVVISMAPLVGSVATSATSSFGGGVGSLAVRALPLLITAKDAIVSRVGPLFVRSGSAVEKLTERPILHVPIRTLQHMFNRHAKAFGVTGNWDKAMAGEFEEVVRSHMQGLVPIQGTYRGTIQALHYFDPSTRLNVMTDLSGNLIGGWQLGVDQVKHLLTTGAVK